jgi:AraC-like DNA-binding protein
MLGRSTGNPDRYFPCMTAHQLSLRRYDDEVRLHQHDFHQIVLPRAGALHLDIDGRGGVVAHGRGAFIPAGSDHAFRARGPNSFVVLDVPAQAVPGVVSPFFVISPPLQHLLDFLGDAGAQDDDIPAAMREPWAALLLATLTGPPPVRPGTEQAIVERALRHMRRYLDRDLTVGDIARAAGAGPTRLYRLFRDRLGRTPHDTLAELRLDVAQHLLAATSLPIAEIARRTGHADQSTLTRRLRRSRGVTPAAYRRGMSGSGSGS